MLVSKNVCHRVKYDHALHETVRAAAAAATVLAKVERKGSEARAAANGRSRSLELLSKLFLLYLFRRELKLRKEWKTTLVPKVKAHMDTIASQGRK